jgi:hypothetical protein
LEYLKGRDGLGDENVDRKIILKKWAGWTRAGFIWPRIETGVGLL